MRHLNKIATAFCGLALGLVALSGCEGADLYDNDTPDWLAEKIDSINNARQSHEEVLEGMHEDVYTIGKTDFSTGWWAAFSKYYVIGENQISESGYFIYHIFVSPADRRTRNICAGHDKAV